MALRVSLFLLVLAVVQELVLRSVFPVPEVLNFDRSHYSHLGFVPGVEAPSSLAHASFRWVSDPDGFAFVHRLNLYGFRDHEWEASAPDDATRVAFVGDSFVEGFSSDAGDTIPEVFGQLSREAGVPRDLLNLGVGGGSLESYARLLRDAAPLFRPDAVILVLFANDVIPVRFDPGWLADALEPVRANPWQPRLLHVARGLASAQPVPRRWHAPPFDFLPAVPDPRNPWSDGRTAGRLEATVEPAIARAIRAGRFNPMLTGALPWFRTNLQRPVELDPHLTALRGFLRPLGASLAVVYLPSKHQVSDRYLPAQAAFSPPDSLESLMPPEFQVQARLLAASCARLGLPFLDLSPGLRERETRGAPLYWEYDDHMRAAGYRAAAELIFAWWSGPAAAAP